MTSFNYAAYIGAAIQSVLDQSCPDWELLIVDDRSTDESWEIIQGFDDPRIQSYRQPVNSGACAAYNFALSKASGRYIASLDSDDVFLPSKLERQREFLDANPGVGVCGVFVSEIDRSGAPMVGATPYADWFNVDLDLNDPVHWIWTNHICHSGAVVRSDVHRAIGLFNADLFLTPDWEFWLRALISNAGFAVLPEQLVAYRNHGANITQNDRVNARTSQEHARVASDLLIPWLRGGGRFDLLSELIGGFVTRATGDSDFDDVAKALVGGAGAADAAGTALRVIADQRVSMAQAEKWRLELHAAYEETLARISSYVEIEKMQSLELAAWRGLDLETRTRLQTAEAALFELQQSLQFGGLAKIRSRLSAGWALLRNYLGRPAKYDRPRDAFGKKANEDLAKEVFLSDSHGVKFSTRAHKTLLVVHELSRTGAPRVVLYLAQAIRKLTGDVPVIWSPVDGDIRAEFEAHGFPVIVDPLILAYQPAHASSQTAVASFERVIATSLSSYPFVRHHGAVAKRLMWWIHEETAGFDYLVTQHAPDLATLFERCEAIWLGSPLCFAPAGRFVEHQKLVMLLYGCEDASRPAVLRPDGRLVVTIAGSLEPRKGQDIFLDAIELLSDAQRSAALFRIVGSSTQWFASFEEAIRTRASRLPQVECIPNVPLDRLNDLYAETDVVVSASRSDPMPIAITQGLMFAKVCVCSSAIGHATLLHDGQDALIFASESASQLAEKLAWLISNRQALAGIGAAGREVYEARFTENQFVANVEYLLQHSRH